MTRLMDAWMRALGDGLTRPAVPASGAVSRVRRTVEALVMQVGREDAE